MKHLYFLFYLLLLSCQVINAQTQQGIVKTRGRMVNGQVVAGTRLQGATVTVNHGETSVSGSKGSFSFVMRAKTYSITAVQKQGYQLCDPDMLNKGYQYSANPFVIVMDTPDQILEDKLESAEKIRATLTAQLKQQKNELMQLKEQQKLSEEEYYRQLQELYAAQDNNNKLVSEMAERYSALDFDQMTDFQRQVAAYIQNGELMRADSLLNTKGSMEERSAELDRLNRANAEERQKLEDSEKLAETLLQDFAADCYSHYEICKMLHKNDSAAYWLELRASKDQNNLDWQLELGVFLENYLAQYDKAEAIYKKVVEYAVKEYGPNHYSTACCLENLAILYFQRNNFLGARKIYERIINIASKSGSGNNLLVKAYSRLGACYEHFDNMKKAKESFEKVLAIMQKGDGISKKILPTCYNDLARFYKQTGDFDKAIDYYLKAISMIDELGEDKEIDKAVIYVNLGILYSSMARYQDAAACYEKGIEIDEKFLGEDHPTTAHAYMGKGGLMIRLGKYSSALNLFNASLEIFLDIYGERSDPVIIVYSNLGCLFLEVGMYDKAKIYLDEVLRITHELYGEGHSYEALSLAYLAEIDIKNKLYDDAIEKVKKSISIYTNLYGRMCKELYFPYSVIAKVYARKNDITSSLDAYNKAIEITKKYDGNMHPNLADLYNNIGTELYNDGRYSESINYYTKAVNIRQKVFGKESTEVAETYSNMANVYYKSNNLVKAIEFMQKNLQIRLLVHEDNDEEITPAYNFIYVCMTQALEQRNVGVTEDDFVDFMSELIPMGEVSSPESPAYLKGLKDKFYLMELAGWNICDRSSVFTTMAGLSGQPKSIVVINGDSVERHDFENSIGANFYLYHVGKTEKERLLKMYYQWKEQDGK